MAFWIICAVLTGLGVAVLMRPLIRKTAVDADHNETAIAIYRDQLIEIERDLERNLINSEEAGAAKLEVSRRLLAADEATRAAAVPTDGGTAPAKTDEFKDKFYEHLAIVLATVTIVMSMGGYLMLGNPGMPGMPHAARMAADPATVPVEELIARVEERLRQNPDDAKGWDIIAPVYLKRAEFVKAAGAYQRTIQLNGESPRRLAEFAQSMLGATNGDVSDAVIAVYERLLVLRPDDLPAQFWLSVGLEQRNETRQAIESYRKLLTRDDLPAPLRHLITSRLARLGKTAPPLPSASASTQRSDAPTAADGTGRGGDKVAAPSKQAREAMAQLSPQERQQQIRAMVDSLASRLREENGEVAEWQRLIRAFRVLGETKEAEQAYRDALQAFKDKPEESRALKTFAAQMGVAIEADDGQ